MTCVEDFAPGITVPIGMQRPLFSGPASTLCAEGLRFTRGSTNLEVFPSALDEVAERLKREPGRTVFLHGVCLPGESATPEACEALGHARARVVASELTRRGVASERLVEQTLTEFQATRPNPAEQEMPKEFDAPVVWVYGPPPDPIYVDPPRPEPCYPGVEAELTLTPEEFSPDSGTIMALNVCLAGGCARGKLGLDTLASGDKVIWRLEGYPSTGMILDWRTERAKLVVRSLVPPDRLRNGDRYQLTLDLGSRRVRTLDAILQLPEGDACRVAVIR